MSVPNLKHVVQAVRDSRAWDFSTKEGLCAYSNAVVVALHAADPEFGHLSKGAGGNNCPDPRGRLRAVDASLYKPTGQAMDFIGSAGVGQPNPVTWGTQDPEGKYGPEKWFAPVAGPVVDPKPDPPPLPPPPSGALEARVAMLEGQLATILERLDLKADKTRVEAINMRFADESRTMNVHKPLPDYYGRNWAGGVTSKPKE